MNRQRGFTLLELMVVLALAALVIGIVLPFGARALDNAERRGAHADLGALLAGLPMKAYFSGQALEVDATWLRSALPGLPAHCVLTMTTTLKYAGNGMAEGGELGLTCAGDVVQRFLVAPVTGAVSGAKG